MDGSEKEEIGARLAREGVPQSVIEHISKYSRVGSLDMAVVIVFIFISIFLLTNFILLSMHFEDIMRPSIYIFAARMGGVLYEYGLLYHIIVGIIGILLISFALSMFSTLSLTNWQAASFAAFVTSPARKRFTRQLQRLIMARLANEADPARYVRRFVFMPAWFLAGAGVLVLAISVPLAFCEVRAFEVFTPDDYYVSPLLPWETPRFLPWASAVSVEIGCNHYQAKGGPVNRMIYAVNFSDGTVASPAYAPPVGGSWLDGMEIIDATLRSAGVRFVPQAVMSVHAYHPRCIATLRHDFSSDDFRRLQRVLRLPE